MSAVELSGQIGVLDCVRKRVGDRIVVEQILVVAFLRLRVPVVLRVPADEALRRQVGPAALGVAAAARVLTALARRAAATPLVSFVHPPRVGAVAPFWGLGEAGLTLGLGASVGRCRSVPQTLSSLLQMSK